MCLIDTCVQFPHSGLLRIRNIPSSIPDADNISWISLEERCKIVSVLNYVARHDCVWRNGGIAPLALNLCSEWSSLTRFLSRLLNSRGPIWQKVKLDRRRVCALWLTEVSRSPARNWPQVLPRRAHNVVTIPTGNKNSRDRRSPKNVGGYNCKLCPNLSCLLLGRTKLLGHSVKSFGPS